MCIHNTQPPLRGLHYRGIRLHLRDLSCLLSAIDSTTGQPTKKSVNKKNPRSHIWRVGNLDQPIPNPKGEDRVASFKHQFFCFLSITNRDECRWLEKTTRKQHWNIWYFRKLASTQTSTEIQSEIFIQNSQPWEETQNYSSFDWHKIVSRASNIGRCQTCEKGGKPGSTYSKP